MRCKPGDLALITRGCNAGQMVSCLRLEAPGVKIPAHARGRVWLIDRGIVWAGSCGSELELPYCPDDFLMPIRPSGQTGDVIASQRHSVAEPS